MSLKKYSLEQPQLLTHEHQHLQFSSRANMPRVQSLRKVTADVPTFAPEVH